MIECEDGSIYRCFHDGAWSDTQRGLLQVRWQTVINVMVFDQHMMIADHNLPCYDGHIEWDNDVIVQDTCIVFRDRATKLITPASLGRIIVNEFCYAYVAQDNDENLLIKGIALLQRPPRVSPSPSPAMLVVDEDDIDLTELLERTL